MIEKYGLPIKIIKAGKLLEETSGRTELGYGSLKRFTFEDTTIDDKSLV